MARDSEMAPRTKLSVAWYGARRKIIAETKAPKLPQKRLAKKNIPKTPIK